MCWGEGSWFGTTCGLFSILDFAEKSLEEAPLSIGAVCFERWVLGDDHQMPLFVIAPLLACIPRTGSHWERRKKKHARTAIALPPAMASREHRLDRPGVEHMAAAILHRFFDVVVSILHRLALVCAEQSTMPFMV